MKKVSTAVQAFRLANRGYRATASAAVVLALGGLTTACTSASTTVRYTFETPVIDWAHAGLNADSSGNIYAVPEGSNALQVSHDSGTSWLTLNPPDPIYRISFLWATKTSLIANASGRIYRSDTGGTSWTRVLDLGQPAVTTLASGFAEGPPGTLYVAAYSTTVGAYPSGMANIYRSSDDGRSWSILFSFPSTMAGGRGPFAVRHVHGVFYLNGSVYVTTGDNDIENAIWRWDGRAMRRQTPAQTNAGGGQRWRAVGLAYRHGYLYWGRDSGGGSDGEVGKAPVSDLGKYTRLGKLPSGVFYWSQLRDGALVFNTDNEGRQYDLDQFVRVYVVDGRDHVEELWKAARNPSVGPGTIVNAASTGLWTVPTTGQLGFTPSYLMSLDPPGGRHQYSMVSGYVTQGASRAGPVTQGLS